MAAARKAGRQRPLEREQEGRNSRHGEKEDSGVLMRKRLAVPLALAVAGLLVPAAHAAPPDPFGHACAPQNGVMFCPTALDTERVPSFDGVPLDVDVTLPPSGDGPFPTIVMMHGYGGSKTSFEGLLPEPSYNNIFYARQGYAVVTYSARGFGRSCGRPDSRTSPACDAGWIHLADHRYEGRDTQHLLGLWLDQGVGKTDAPRRDGVSYGGIQRASNLARLRDAVRLPDGSFSPGEAPTDTARDRRGHARWPGSDLTYPCSPTGASSTSAPRAEPEHPARRGDEEELQRPTSTTAGNATALRPKGGAFSSDITDLEGLADRGERRADALAVAGTDGITQLGGPHGHERALIVQNGWTDDLFPARRRCGYTGHSMARGAHASRYSSGTSDILAGRTIRREHGGWGGGGAAGGRGGRHGAAGRGLLRPRIPQGAGQGSGASDSVLATTPEMPAPSGRRPGSLQGRELGGACTPRTATTTRPPRQGRSG